MRPETRRQNPTRNMAEIDMEEIPANNPIMAAIMEKTPPARHHVPPPSPALSENQVRQDVRWRNEERELSIIQQRVEFFFFTRHMLLIGSILDGRGGDTPRR